MNGNILKLLALLLIVLVIIFVVKNFSGQKSEPSAEPKTFQEVIAEDDTRLRADIEQPESNKIENQAAELTPEQQVDAERFFEMALAQRKMARLPGVSYKLMVDYCRELIRKYPNSQQAAKARRMLAEVPDQYRKLYKITDEEIGISK